MDTNTAAIILEGPEGFDLTRETFGITPVRRLVTIFQLAGVSRIAIAGDSGMKDIERTCTKLGAEFFSPGKGGDGVMGGLCAALHFLKGKCRHALITTANFQMFEIETARRMAKADTPVAIPVYNGERGWPVCISEELFDSLIALGGDLYALLSEVDAAEVVMDDAGVTADTAFSSADALAAGHSLRKTLRPTVRVSLAHDQAFFGAGIQKLIRLIDETGSVTQALQLMGMAKSKGHKLLNEFEKHTGIKIYDYVGHGSPANKSVVSDECRDFCSRYEAFSSDCERYVAESFKRHFEGFELHPRSE